MFKRITALLLGAALTLSLAGCTGSNPSSTADGSKKITMVLDWTPNTNHTGLFVAQELGYYKEAGLEVEIVQPPEGGVTPIVASGKAQFGINAQDTLAPALVGENAMPITAVATLIQHNTSGILSLKGNGMDTPKGMEGKRYATWENPVEQAIVRSIVEADGGKFENITMIPSSPVDIITALQTDVDAIWIFYAWDGIATEVKGLETDYLDLGKLDPVFDYYTPILFANNDFLQEDPEAAKAFLAATARGYEYAIEDPEAAAEILLKAAPELDRDIVMASQKWLSTQYKAEVEQWGYIDPARWNGFYAWLNEKNLIEGGIEPNTGFSNDYLS